jgi:hypothetical protein
MRKHKCSIFPADQCDGSCFVPDPDPGLNWPSRWVPGRSQSPSSRQRAARGEIPALATPSPPEKP